MTDLSANGPYEPLAIRAGEALTLNLSVPEDLTDGRPVRLYIVSRLNGADVVTGEEMAVTNAAAGEVTFDLVDADTVTPGSYRVYVRVGDSDASNVYPKDRSFGLDISSNAARTYTLAYFLGKIAEVLAVQTTVEQLLAQVQEYAAAAATSVSNAAGFAAEALGFRDEAESFRNETEAIKEEVESIREDIGTPDPGSGGGYPPRVHHGKDPSVTRDDGALSQERVGLVAVDDFVDRAPDDLRRFDVYSMYSPERPRSVTGAQPFLDAVFGEGEITLFAPEVAGTEYYESSHHVSGQGAAGDNVRRHGGDISDPFTGSTIPNLSSDIYTVHLRAVAQIAVGPDQDGNTRVAQTRSRWTTLGTGEVSQVGTVDPGPDPIGQMAAPTITYAPDGGEPTPIGQMDPPTVTYANDAIGQMDPPTVTYA